MAAMASSARTPVYVCLLLVWLQSATAASVDDRHSIRVNVPKPPKFAESFELGYTFSMPYLKTLQSKGLHYPVYVWYDGVNQRLREDVLHGLDSTIITKDEFYTIYPRVNKTICDVEGGGAGPTLLRGSNGHVPSPLPDISDWTYGGTAYVRGQEAYVWRYTYKADEKVNTYSFYTSASGAPIRFYMMGRNILVGSHFDEYLIDFHTYIPSIKKNSRAFNPPRACDEVRAKAATGSLSPSSSAVRRATRTLSLLPSAHIPTSGIPVAKPQIPATRAANLKANQAFVAAWNAQNSDKSFKVGLNKFSFWSDEEYSALLSKKAAPKKLLKSSSKYQRVLKDEDLPKEVDYRGTGADGEVKDQATCGSCWAFAAVGSMQGVWFKATQQQLSLSEQQLVDCSWDYGYNQACDGGDYGPAIEYIAEIGGSVQEEDYQYLGVDAFCKNSLIVRGGSSRTSKHHPKPVAFFSKYVEVPTRDEKALMEALYLHGPIAVSLDASQSSFRFYTEGVYDEPKCMIKADDLDHAVLLVGYGTTEAGKDYWIIRNSWSKLWGEDGYIKIARDNDCGITTDPGFPGIDTTKLPSQ